MPVSLFMQRRLVAAAVLALASGSTVAAENAEHAARAEAPKAMASAASAASAAPAASTAHMPMAPAAPMASAAPMTPAASRGPKDPMELLREKLAAKLGATRPADNANVVRVVSKSTADEADDPSTLTIRPRILRPPGMPRHRPEVSDAMMVPPRPVTWDYGSGYGSDSGASTSGGPENWGQLKPEFAKCTSGKRQSPIDIQDGIKVNLDPVQFDYKRGGFRVIDNGHTVQVNVASGSSIDVMGRHFDLVRFDFQRPSEERVNGRQFDMGIHLVHRDADGHFAVVALLLEKGNKAQPVVQSVWNNLPLEKGDELAARTALDPTELLPAERGYFTYMGSLTAPPCSEGVLWMVMKQPVQVTAEQLAIFARLYPMNARPVQSASGRLIKESN